MIRFVHRTAAVTATVGVAAAVLTSGSLPAQEVGSEPPPAATSDREAASEEGERQRRRRPVTRETAELDTAAGRIELAYGLAPVDGPDFAQLAAAEPGKIVALTRHSAIKLKTEADLDFGETKIQAGNVAAGYPGVYSLWLKPDADGWRLVVNAKPDVWGTQHDPASDVGEIELSYEQAEEGTDRLTGELIGVGDGGLLVLSWGRHRWSAVFEATAHR